MDYTQTMRMQSQNRSNISCVQVDESAFRTCSLISWASYSISWRKFGSSRLQSVVCTLHVPSSHEHEIGTKQLTKKRQNTGLFWISYHISYLKLNWSSNWGSSKNAYISTPFFKDRFGSSPGDDSELAHCEHINNESSVSQMMFKHWTGFPFVLDRRVGQLGMEWNPDSLHLSISLIPRLFEDLM